MSLQALLVAFLIAASAVYAGGRLLPTPLVERALSRLESLQPTLARLVRRWAGRARSASGAATESCSNCAAAPTERVARPDRRG